jgi:hypothetical protein
MSIFRLPDYFQYPEPYKDGINTEVFIDFDWRDRLKILFGYRVKVEVVTFCENHPGQVESRTAATTLPHRRNRHTLAYEAESKEKSPDEGRAR